MPTAPPVCRKTMFWPEEKRPVLIPWNPGPVDYFRMEINSMRTNFQANCQAGSSSGSPLLARLLWIRSPGV